MPAFGSIQFSDILRTTRDDETKTITAQIGDVVGEDVESDNVEMWGQQGIVARPAKAEPKKAACQGIILRETGHDVCIATRDLRGQEIAGNLKEGETCVYAPGADGKSQGRSLYKQDGSVSHVTMVGNVAGGATVGMFIQPSGNVDIVAKDAALLLRPNDASLFTSEASVALDGADIKAFASGKANINASTIVLGGEASQPTLNASDISAILTAVAAMITTSAAPSAGSVSATIPGLVSGLIANLQTRKTRNE